MRLRFLFLLIWNVFDTQHTLFVRENKYGVDNMDVIDLGNGIFNISEPIYLNDNQSLTIKGSHNTTLHYVASSNNITLFESYGRGSHLKVMNLTISSNGSFIQQIYVSSGAMIEFESVVFDGNNYIQSNTDSIWELGPRSIAVFNNCTFRNNDVKYIFDGANVTFIDCTFNANVPTSVSHSIQNLDSEGMFIIESAATLSLISCIVSNVHRMSRPLFTLYSGDLFIQKTNFSNISGIARYPQGEYENSLFYIATEARSSIQINEALFQTIADQLAILSIHPSSSNFCLVVVSDCVFRHNNVRSDYFGHFYAFLLLSNNHFANSIATQGSLFLFSTSYVVIENTIWDDYTVAVSVIVKTQSSDTHNSINNITMKNIHGGCMDIAYASSPVIISNSRFENISYAGNSCILLTTRQQYLFRNNRFENCSGWQAAIIVKEPDGVSVFENLTFIPWEKQTKYDYS